MKRGVMVLLLVVLLAGCVAATPTATPTQTPAATASATAVPPTVAPTAAPTPEARVGWWNDAVFYEVFVRSFYDSDGDGAGDLPGLIERLDYLNDGDPNTDTDLGVTALWLMPIMQSPSYHGYDAIDYYTVEQDYGVNEDFRQLIDAAHQRGIRVIIDLVLNHTSSAHPWFINSSTGDDAEKRDWYVWTDHAMDYSGPWGEQVWYPRGGDWYYAVFWSEMPDLNYENPDVTQQMYDVARFWLEDMGADGFRLDAVRYLVEADLDSEQPLLASAAPNLAWLQQFRDYYSSVAPEAMTVGEVWADTSEASRYVDTGALDLAFEFNLADAIIEGVMRSSPAPILSAMERIVADYPAGDYATFLTNHDQNRVLNQLGGNLARAKLAAATYLTLPGVPFIYYGEEIGMSGSKPDELIRTPMQWSAEEDAGFTAGRPWESVNADYIEVNVVTEAADPDSLFNTYRQFVSLRNAHPALRQGSFTPLESSDRPVFAYLRLQGEDRLLLVLNYSAQARGELTLSLSASDLPAGVYAVHDLLTGTQWPDVTVGAAGEFAAPWVVAGLAERQVLMLQLDAQP